MRDQSRACGTPGPHGPLQGLVSSVGIRMVDLLFVTHASLTRRCSSGKPMEWKPCPPQWDLAAAFAARRKVLTLVLTRAIEIVTNGGGCPSTWTLWAPRLSADWLKPITWAPRLSGMDRQAISVGAQPASGGKHLLFFDLRLLLHSFTLSCTLR